MASRSPGLFNDRGGTEGALGTLRDARPTRRARSERAPCQWLDLGHQTWSRCYRRPKTESTLLMFDTNAGAILACLNVRRSSRSNRTWFVRGGRDGCTWARLRQTEVQPTGGESRASEDHDSKWSRRNPVGRMNRITGLRKVKVSRVSPDGVDAAMSRLDEWTSALAA